ncbi:trypco2 family protein [Streptomyces sp. NPDC058326]|uniref:trypco2 family protein n=1 Tax=Streptomyces sp. NPDC058326 TaxID=3346447 RepID=UPI0036E26FB2
MHDGISLAEALRKVREELYAAQAEGAHEQFRFEVEQAELTLEVEFRRDGNGKVKVDVGALGAKVGGEAGGTLGTTRRQTLTLTLQVRDEALGGERARIRRLAGGLSGPSGSPDSGPDDPEGNPDRGPHDPDGNPDRSPHDPDRRTAAEDSDVAGAAEGAPESGGTSAAGGSSDPSGASDSSPSGEARPRPWEA